MVQNGTAIDESDIKIIRCIQRDATLSQRELAEQVGMSQNACWRRLQKLKASGILRGAHADVDLSALGFDLTVFVMIKTRHHSAEWAERFRTHVERLPQVTDFYRIGGEWDYLIKVRTQGMSGYDGFYRRLISGFDLATVTGFFAMETITDNRPLDIYRNV